MFRKNDQHLQKPMFSSLFDLPDKEKDRLSHSWAGTFYEYLFCRIDEDIFSILYSDKASRPNIPVNVLVGLEIMKSGFGWSDAELENALHFNLQARYALGYSSLNEGHFELRTVYNFRHRLTQHMQETGENLLEEVFEQVTDEQIETLKLKTGKMRMDSTQISSNIRQMSRLQLLVEVLQRVWRLLVEEEIQANYEETFSSYVKNTSGQFIYHVKPGESQKHLEAIGHLMRHLIGELAADYQNEPIYQMLARVYDEHFIEVESGLRPKAGKELSAQSLQSPDDWEATYRKKNRKGYKGYVTNITETCDPENDLQLIVKVQTESNSVDDADMFEEAIPNLVERTNIDEAHTDGGYNSDSVDKTLFSAKIEQYQTAIRGRKSKKDSLGVSDFVFARDEKAVPQTVQCPHGQQVEVWTSRKSDRFTAHFDQAICETCPFATKCPTKKVKRKSKRVLRFSQKEVNIAHRCENQRKAKASGRNLRSAVEASVRSVKHPFGNGKLPVRGKRRMSMMMVSSAAMDNVRRIWRYSMAKNSKIETGNAPNRPVSNCFRAFLRPILRFQVTPKQYQPLAA